MLKWFLAQRWLKRKKNLGVSKFVVKWVFMSYGGALFFFPWNWSNACFTGVPEGVKNWVCQFLYQPVTFLWYRNIGKCYYFTYSKKYRGFCSIPRTPSTGAPELYHPRANLSCWLEKWRFLRITKTRRDNARCQNKGVHSKEPCKVRFRPLFQQTPIGVYAWHPQFCYPFKNLWSNGTKIN